MTGVPSPVPNWIGGVEVAAACGESFDKLSPATGKTLWRSTRSRDADVQAAVSAALAAQPAWGDTPAVERGALLHKVANAIEADRDRVAAVVAAETGKSSREALGETAAAVALARFMAGEGQRLYGRTTTSAVPNRSIVSMRFPVGVAGLIVAANTPIANVAWKVFPALICGNAAVLKAAEDTPATAWLLAQIAAGCGLPGGVLNVLQGYGAEAGAALVRHPDVGVLSFTGSAAVGRGIAEVAGRRLAKVSLELGGKNPLVVCDDADLGSAVRWTVLSAFSNAGQRCASGSRVIVFDKVYDEFRDRVVAATCKLRVGPGDDDDLGPVIREGQLKAMLDAVGRAKAAGATVLTGGERLTNGGRAGGYYLAPTLIEGAGADDDISTAELFGPLATLYRVAGFTEALALANHSPYGLTAAIHTRNVNRALEFTHRVRAGVVVVNAGTYGSEAHLPFGGVKQSGNGTREPGTEALDIYSDLRNIVFNRDPAEL